MASTRGGAVPRVVVFCAREGRLTSPRVADLSPRVAVLRPREEGLEPAAAAGAEPEDATRGGLVLPRVADLRPREEGLETAVAAGAELEVATRGGSFCTLAHAAFFVL